MEIMGKKIMASWLVLIPAMKLAMDLNLVFDLEAIAGTLIFMMGLLYLVFNGE